MLPFKPVDPARLAAVLAKAEALAKEMAVRLSKAFGGSPALWLEIQMDYDLASIVCKAPKIRVHRELLPS
jgi:addiction module HigA family antidote